MVGGIHTVVTSKMREALRTFGIAISCSAPI